MTINGTPYPSGPEWMYEEHRYRYQDANCEGARQDVGNIVCHSLFVDDLIATSLGTGYRVDCVRYPTNPLHDIYYYSGGNIYRANAQGFSLPTELDDYFTLYPSP